MLAEPSITTTSRVAPSSPCQIGRAAANAVPPRRRTRAAGSAAAAGAAAGGAGRRGPVRPGPDAPSTATAMAAVATTTTTAEESPARAEISCHAASSVIERTPAGRPRRPRGAFRGPVPPATGAAVHQPERTVGPAGAPVVRVRGAGLLRTPRRPVPPVRGRFPDRTNAGSHWVGAMLSSGRAGNQPVTRAPRRRRQCSGRSCSVVGTAKSPIQCTRPGMPRCSSSAAACSGDAATVGNASRCCSSDGRAELPVNDANASAPAPGTTTTSASRCVRDNAPTTAARRSAASRRGGEPTARLADASTTIAAVRRSSSSSCFVNSSPLRAYADQSSRRRSSPRL